MPVQSGPTNPHRKPVAVVIGATSKWGADGANTKLVFGAGISETDMPVTARWGAGGAISQKFAAEGFFVVLTTRHEHNAAALAQAILASGGECMIVELDVSSEQSITAAFARVRTEAGSPEVVVYNAGYLDGRDLPAGNELIEYIPVSLFDNAHHVASRGPFLVAREVLPDMRRARKGALFFSNNPLAFRGKKRRTGESLYYPRVMMRHLAQVLTEEYSEFNIHIANVTIDGLIDSPGTRALPSAQSNPEIIMDTMAIAEAYYYLYLQHPSCWTHEIQLTPYSRAPSY